MNKLWRWSTSFLKNPATSKRYDSIVFDQHLEEAQKLYNESVRRLENEHKIHRYKWRYDTKHMCLYFEHKKQKLPPLQAKAQIIGSYFKTAQTFEWSWNTPNLPKKSTRAARKVRHYGRCNGQPLLYLGAHPNKPHIKQCYYFAALTLFINKGQFIYQGESQDQVVFFLMDTLSLSNNCAE